ncbi:MAG: hypothetical protein AAF664_10065 [Planctomycetota bacterium]
MTSHRIQQGVIRTRRQELQQAILYTFPCPNENTHEQDEFPSIRVAAEHEQRRVGY